MEGRSRDLVVAIANDGDVMAAVLDLVAHLEDTVVKLNDPPRGHGSKA
jgi:hypothetical protein